MKSKLAELISTLEAKENTVKIDSMVPEKAVLEAVLIEARQLLAEEQSQKPEASAGLITEIEDYFSESDDNSKWGNFWEVERDIVNIISKYTPAKEQCGYTKNELRTMLEDVVSVLDLSDSTIEKHGPLGTPPAQLVKEVLDEKDMIIKMLKNGMKCIESNPAKEQEPLAVLAERKGYCKTTAFHTVVGTWWILLSDCYGKEWTSSPQSNPTNYTLQEAESKARKYLESLPDKKEDK